MKKSIQTVRDKESGQKFIAKTPLDRVGLRRVFVIFIFLYAVFAFLDTQLYDSNWLFLWVLRFGIVIPLFLSTIILTYQKWFDKIHRWYIALNLFIGGAVIAIMLVLMPTNLVYYGGLFMVYFSGYLLIQLPVLHATVSGVSIFLFHIISTTLWNGFPSDTEGYGLIFLIGANLIGFFGSMNIEQNKRKLLEQSEKLTIAYQSMQKQNRQNETQLQQLNQFIQESADLKHRFKERESLIIKLEDAQKRFDELSIQSKTFFYEISTDGTIIYASKSFETILGYALDEVLTIKKIFDFFPLNLRTRYLENYQEMIMNQRVFSDFVHPICRKSGEIIWVRSSSAPLLDDHGIVHRFHCSGVDITKHKQAINELQLFKSITDQSKYGSALSTIDGILVYVNQAFCEMHGFLEEELIGKPIAMVHSEEQMKNVSSLLNQMRTEGSFTNEEVWHQRKNKETFPTIMTGKLIYLDGEPRYFSATMFDISKEKQIQLELANTKKQFEMILSENDIPIASHTVLFDANQQPIDYRYDYVNPAFEKLIGLKQSQIIGKTVLELLPNTEKYWIEEYAKVAQTQISMRYTNYASQFDKWFSVSAYCPQKGQFAVLISDITELKKQEEKVLYVYRHDSMTGLPNRMYFEERIIELEKEGNLPVGIMMIDINGLKLINDSFGNYAGDQVLIQVAGLLKETSQSTDFVARVGGDEFIIICPFTSTEKMDHLKEQLLDGVSQLMIDDLHYSLSIGYDIKTKKNQNLKETLVSAENDMHRTKVFHGQSVRSRAIMSIYSTLTHKYIDELVHSERVSDYCRLIGEQLQLNEEELNELSLAGKLHDIGKISIPDDVLKKPGKLTKEEWKTMKEHTVNGYQILRAADEYSELASYALSHHERIDGLGYPNGLKGEEIPLFARIIHVADAYEAMTSNRPYREALKRNEAIQELLLHKGTQFDSELVDIFVNHVLIHEK